MTPTQSHTRFIVTWIGILGLAAAIAGTWLLWKGFAGGGELVVTLNSAISGLVGFLGGRGMNNPATTTTATATDAGSVVTTETAGEGAPAKKGKK